MDKLVRDRGMLVIRRSQPLLAEKHDPSRDLLSGRATALTLSGSFVLMVVAGVTTVLLRTHIPWWLYQLRYRRSVFH